MNLRKQLDNFFSESPSFRWLYRGGSGRRMMLKYRTVKRIRRPQRFIAKQISHRLKESTIPSLATLHIAAAYIPWFPNELYWVEGK